MSVNHPSFLRFRGTAAALGLALLLAAPLAGCGGGDDAAQETPAGETGADLKATPGSSELAASVNGQAITVEDLDRVYDNLVKQNVPPDTTIQGGTREERLRKTALKVLIEQALVVQAAEKAGLTVTDEEVQTRLSMFQSQAGGVEAFNKMLADAGVSEDLVVRDLKERMTIDKYFSQKVNMAPEVSDAEARDFYERNAAQFASQPEVHARHILLRTQEGMDDMAKAELRGRAESLLAEIRGGADFAELAKQHSGDPTNAQNGGDLGWFRKGMMVPPFEEVAFSLKPGEVGGPVETRFGYHLIKVEETRDSEGRTFESAEQQIRMMAAQEKSVKASEALIDSLRGTADIKTY